VYRNESEVCEAVKIFQKNSSTNSATGNVFLTTKVTGKEHGTDKTDKAVEESVQRANEHGLVWVSKTFPSPASRESFEAEYRFDRICSSFMTLQVDRNDERKRGKY